MKQLNIIIMAVVPLLAVFPSVSGAQTTITFDDLNVTSLPGYDSGSGTAPIPNGYGANGYGGFQWNNFDVMDTPYFDNSPDFQGDSGYANGTVSANNVAYDGYGQSASFSGGAFDLDSAYLTSAWNNGMTVEVQGYVGLVLTYDRTYTVNFANPTLIDFNYLGVDEVNFIPSGGVPVYEGIGNEAFAMDNLTISPPTPTPEPNVSALGVLGAAALFVYRGRRV